MSNQPQTSSILEISHLTKSFRGLRALDDVSVEVERGAVHGIIGPNGAGKTTLFNCLTGYLAPTKGKISFEGRDITGMRMPAVTRLGIARTFQNIRLFGALSVLDNVRTAQQLRTRFGVFEFLFSTGSFHRKEQMLTEQSMAHLEMFGLAAEADRQASSLAYGMQRRLEIARALATSPKILLLDEPAAGMNHSETDALHQMILEIQQRFDLTIILVEHDMRLIMNICDQITVLNYGQVLASGAPEAIRRDPKVIESYLGTTHQPAAS